MHSDLRKGAAPPPLPTERRSEPREPCHVAALVEVDGQNTPAVVRDLSVSGAFIECSRIRADGQRLRVKFPVVGLPPALGAEVRWVLRGPGGESMGGGVRFDAMGAREMLTWSRYLRSLG